MAMLTHHRRKFYKSLIADLNKATDIIKPLVAANENMTIADGHDKVYQGKMAKWLKICKLFEAPYCYPHPLC